MGVLEVIKSRSQLLSLRRETFKSDNLCIFIFLANIRPSSHPLTRCSVETKLAPRGLVLQ